MQPLSLARSHRSTHTRHQILCLVRGGAGDAIKTLLPINFSFVLSLGKINVARVIAIFSPLLVICTPTTFSPSFSFLLSMHLPPPLLLPF